MGQRRAVFRVDVSPGIGGGHAVRCLALAGQLASHGWRCVFAVEPEGIENVPALNRSKHDIVFVPENFGEARAQEESKWLEAAVGGQADALIVDSYQHGTAFEQACAAWASTLIAIDGTMRPHDVDLLVNGNLGYSMSDHAGIVGKRCRVLLGPEYAVLSPAFSDRRAESLERRRHSGFKVDRILVAFGASDPRNLMPIAVGALEQAGVDAKIDLILGGATANREDLWAALEMSSLDYDVHHWVDEMATMMGRADLFISAAGGSAWEACVMGLPNIAVSVADNQRIIAAPIGAAGGMADLGRASEQTKEEIAAMVVKLNREPALCVEMSTCAAALCDGAGARRVAEAISNV